MLRFFLTHFCPWQQRQAAVGSQLCYGSAWCYGDALLVTVITPPWWQRSCCLRPWIFSSVLTSHSSCHTKQVRSAWSCVCSEKYRSRREASLGDNFKLPGPGQESRIAVSAIPKHWDFSGLPKYVQGGGVSAYGTYGVHLILAAVVKDVFRCTLTKLSSATYL